MTAHEKLAILNIGKTIEWEGFCLVHYKNFKLASYVYAYYLDGKSAEQIQADIDFYKKHVKLNKVYLETHRALVDIPEDQMRMAKKIFEDNGFEVSGGITTTVKVGEAKPAIFDCFCYSDPAHREEFLRIVRYTASLFDEFILDDYYFTPAAASCASRRRGTGAGPSSSWTRWRNSPSCWSRPPKRSIPSATSSSNTPTGMNPSRSWATTPESRRISST